MPIFEYRCQHCAQDFEVLVRRNEEVTCPSCHSKNIEKLLSAHSAPASGPKLPIAAGCDPSRPPCGGPGCCRM